MKRNLGYIILISFTIIFICSCKKDQTSSNSNQNNNDSLLKKNVYVIDSNKLILNTDSTLINKGIYEFKVSGNISPIKINDIIIGSAYDGYIRRVNKVDNAPGKITIQTSFANMEDVFNNLNFEFNISMDSMDKINLLGESIDFTDVTIYKSVGLHIVIKEGNIEIDGDWNFDFDFSDGKLNLFEFSCKNLELKTDIKLEVTASPFYSKKDDIIFTRRSKYFIHFIPAGPVVVPIVVRMDFELRGLFDAQIGTEFKQLISKQDLFQYELGVKYSNGNWSNIFTKESKSTFEATPFTNNSEANLKVGVIPFIKFKLYRILGPYASIGLLNNAKINFSSPSLDWNYYAGSWIQSKVGFQTGILNIADYGFEWNTDTLTYKTPERINRVSGNHQSGYTGEPLKEPIIVRVNDNLGRPQINVPVYFTIKQGNGRFESSSTLTNSLGEAASTYILGNNIGEHVLSISAKNSDGTYILDAPIEFYAYAKDKNSLEIITSEVTSISSNSAMSGGIISGPNNSNIGERGICWSTSPNPTISNNSVINGAGAGTFSSSMTNLKGDTKYYVRAFAKHNSALEYGSEVSFVTLPDTIIYHGTFSGPWSFPDNQPHCDGPLGLKNDIRLDLYSTSSGVAWGNVSFGLGASEHRGTLTGSTFDLISSNGASKVTVNISANKQSVSGTWSMLNSYPTVCVSNIFTANKE